MRNNLKILALMSATVLVSTVSPSLSEALNSHPLDGERSIVRSIAEGNNEDHDEPVLAQAEHGPYARMRQKPADTHAEPQRSGRGAPRRDMHPGPHDPMHDMGHLGLDIAADLAAMEIYIGITPEQSAAWRAYTSALIDFLEPPVFRPGSAGPRPGDDPRLPTANDRPQDGGTQSIPLVATRLADQAIARGEKAQALKTAVEGLRSAITPDQFEKLANAERAVGILPPPRRPKQDRSIPGRADRELPAPVREY